MQSVLRVLAECRIGADDVRVHPTWKRSRRGTVIRAARAWRALSRLGGRDVVHVHLSMRGSFVREGALIADAARRGLPVVATIHGSQFLDFDADHPRLVAAVLRRAAVITCLSPEVVATAQRRAPSALVALVPNPVIPDAEAYPADATPEVALFAGQVGTRKGVDVLVRAWRKVGDQRPAARCIVVGPPGDYVVPEIEGLEVRPPVSASGVRNLLRDARVVVLPSRAEGMPMILTEALASGRPFVSTPVGGIPELAESGGILVPVGDHEALAMELVRVLADPELSRSLGERGRQFCFETRSPEALDGRMRQLYQASVRASRSSRS